jgi:hypothetical protein
VKTTFENLKGKTFEFLHVVDLESNRKPGIYWKCLCTNCGKTVVVLAQNLKAGRSKSCGCMRAALIRHAKSTHEMTRHPAYRAWKAMMQRDRATLGLLVCDPWHEFDAFWRDMGSSWMAGARLTRLDKRAPYEPGNTVWSLPNG